MKTRRSERGNIAILVALMLPMFLGVTALVVDMGYDRNVKADLQNAVDAAALAGIRDLDGTAAKYPFARVSAQHYALQHKADTTAVNVSLNESNSPTGDIVLGQWDFSTRSFTPATAASPEYLVNAVKVTAKRTNATGNAVSTIFAKTFGVNSADVDAVAIAVGGSPDGTCAAPIAVADCSLFGSDGSLKCNQTLTFGQATTDNVGFTLLSANNPTTPTVTCMFAKTLDSPCPGNCDCSNKCNVSNTSDGQIKISNGNNLSQTTVDNINDAVLKAGAAGMFINAPVVSSGLSSGSCGSFQYNQNHAIVGYVTLKLTGASFAPNKAINVTIDCTKSGPKPPGGGFFGLKSTTVYLVK